MINETEKSTDRNKSEKERAQNPGVTFLQGYLTGKYCETHIK